MDKKYALFKIEFMLLAIFNISLLFTFVIGLDLLSKLYLIHPRDHLTWQNFDFVVNKFNLRYCHKLKLLKHMIIF